MAERRQPNDAGPEKPTRARQTETPAVAGPPRRTRATPSEAPAPRIRIKLTRSPIGNRQRHKDTVRSLGLRRMHQVVEQPDNPQIRGMIFAVRHLVEVVE